MGMFGAGRAFNMSFRPQPFGNPGSMRRIPMPMMGNYSQTTNVTIKNGPSGFWGFMGGLFGGLTGNVGMGGGIFGNFSMPMFSGMFGQGCFMPMGGFNTGIGSGVYGMLNGAQQNGPLSESQQIGNLKELFKGFGYTGVIGNGDGTFTIFGGDKGTKTMTYKEAVKFAETLGPKAQGTDPTSKKNDPNLKATQDKWISDHPDLGLKRDGDKVKDKDGNEYEWKDNAYVKKQTQATGNGAAADKTPTPDANKVSKDEVATLVKNGTSVTLKDLGTGSKGDYGGFKIGTLGENENGFPKSIELTRTDGKKPQKMILKEVRPDGVAIYTLESDKATEANKKQEYRLEKDGTSIAFTQRNGDTGYNAKQSHWRVSG